MEREFNSEADAERRLELIRDAVEAAREVAPEEVVEELEAKRNELYQEVLAERHPDPVDERRQRRREERERNRQFQRPVL
ncbi:hypothetical protein [Natrialba asiatica]|uniref:Uncharacterized protein n=1 Tax=Natrialba asiatica (strain ATCC 700177 / DSM 12278 / JCM 9576 / FERM P-10747 / NBRC 102637 / 172P1) TaxID=29540 RepID=M0AEZ6_NATA1|nr:hypothetical protein [Natrialba asiatica]ELY97094.1 hypothetical protein C481_20926 [Natrialba asiatica DSM 12278]